MKNDILIYYDLLKALRTVQEAEQFLREIDNLAANLFRTKGNSFEENLKRISNSNLAFLLREALTKNKINLEDMQAIENFLSGLKSEIKKLKVLKLEIAFDPSDETVSNISNWVAENIGNGIILDINTDLSLIGGAIITFEGKYKDLSLKKRFDDIFQKIQPKDLIRQ